MGRRTAEASRKHRGPLCPRSHTRVTICAASASRGVSRPAQMGGGEASSAHVVATFVSAG